MKYKGLIRKDLMNLTSSLLVLVVMLFIFCLIFIPSGSFFPLFVFVMITAPLMVISTMTQDNEAKWNTFVLTTSVSRTDLVRSKYLLMILLTGIVWVITALLYLVIPFFVVENEFLTPLLVVVTAAISILNGSIMIPLRFKTESPAIHYISIVVIILVAGIVGSAYFFLMDAVGTALYPLAVGIVFGVFVLSLICLGISYLISQKIFAKKEF